MSASSLRCATSTELRGGLRCHARRRRRLHERVALALGLGQLRTGRRNVGRRTRGLGFGQTLLGGRDGRVRGTNGRGTRGRRGTQERLLVERRLRQIELGDRDIGRVGRAGDDVELLAGGGDGQLGRGDRIGRSRARALQVGDRLGEVEPCRGRVCWQRRATRRRSLSRAFRTAWWPAASSAPVGGAPRAGSWTRFCASSRRAVARSLRACATAAAKVPSSESVAMACPAATWSPTRTSSRRTWPATSGKTASAPVDADAAPPVAPVVAPAMELLVPTAAEPDPGTASCAAPLSVLTCPMPPTVTATSPRPAATTGPCAAGDPPPR
jgi:hypothetical protein